MICFFLNILYYRIIEKNGGKAPLTYHQFQTVIAGMKAPSPAETTLTPNNIGNATTPLTYDHDEKYGVPTLEELGELDIFDFHAQCINAVYFILMFQ